MKKYELNLLISPDLTKEKIQSVEKDITSLIESFKGSLMEISPPEKRELGYIIDKKYKQAYLLNIRFSLDPNETSKFKNKIKEKEDIIRYILLTKEKTEKPGKELRRRKKPDNLDLKTKQKKIELGEIDKKIDEILNE